MAFRIVLAKKEGANLNARATYRKLNGEAIAKLHKHQRREEWEKELVEKLRFSNDRDKHHVGPGAQKCGCEISRARKKT